jgi:hypothetical protein
MPISTTILLACLAALKWLFIAVAALFGLLALRAQFDTEVQIGTLRALIGAGAFLVTGLAVGFLKVAIERRVRRGG